MAFSWKPIAVSALLAASALTAPAVAGVTTASAAPAPAPAADPQPFDAHDLKDITLDGRKVDTTVRYQERARRRAAPMTESPAVGTTREWLALDDVQGQIYYKPYTLRGVGDHIEVWVADDIAFPAGDCRGPEAAVVTDAEVAGLVHEFDANIYPKESAAFSVPPARDGSNALIDGDFSGGGNKVVTLVDNVRDDNFYDFPANPTYIAGFFWSVFNEYMDRNIMTIDAFDWAHRTGADPADAPTDDLCTSRPARPHLYEGTFAHEYQHLLQYYTDPNESIAVNEGLSDFAQTLVGYVDGTKTVYDKGGDSHLYCFQGFGTVRTDYNTNPRDCGGPEGSFNLWNEGSNPAAVLADYGHAYQLMLYLYDKFGQEFISALHRDGEHQGIEALEHALQAEGETFADVLHDFQSMTLLDAIVDQAKRLRLSGASKSAVTSASLASSVNLDNPAAYATPGAAPNGADYVQLTARGKKLSGKKLRSVTFKGATTLPTLPLAWTTVADDPDRAGDPVLFSGNANSLDVAAVTEVSVPADDPTLTFVAKYGAEAGYDYGYVQVSTDGGQTYTSIAGDRTVEGPLGPSLNGATTGFEAHAFDLSAYAGQTILLAFRYVSDGGVNEGGLKIDDIAVGGVTVSDGSSLAAFSSTTEIYPTPVANWHVKLIGIGQSKAGGPKSSKGKKASKSSKAKKAKKAKKGAKGKKAKKSSKGKKAKKQPKAKTTVVQLAWDGRSSIRVSKRDLARLRQADSVVAVIAYDEPTAMVQQYAPYTLTVNGQVQPGGR